MASKASKVNVFSRQLFWVLSDCEKILGGKMVVWTAKVGAVA